MTNSFSSSAKYDIGHSEDNQGPSVMLEIESGRLEIERAKECEAWLSRRQCMIGNECQRRGELLVVLESSNVVNNR